MTTPTDLQDVVRRRTSTGIELGGRRDGVRWKGLETYTNDLKGMTTPTNLQDVVRRRRSTGIELGGRRDEVRKLPQTYKTWFVEERVQVLNLEVDETETSTGIELGRRRDGVRWKELETYTDDLKGMTTPTNLQDVVRRRRSTGIELGRRRDGVRWKGLKTYTNDLKRMTTPTDLQDVVRRRRSTGIELGGRRDGVRWKGLTGNLASTYGDQGRWNEAEQLEVQVMDMRKKLLASAKSGNSHSLSQSHCQNYSLL
ncbi:hypothetical protein BYT27DRAFT_7265694 [Phlegmacium glaucopus]|nr:hypothetical protein BYT27DRAFT_7265694 [Phlegmacium glaucopus]